MSNSLPMIRIDIEHFRESVHHAMMLRDDEIKKYVAENLDRALKNINIENIVEKQMRACIEKEIEDFFKWGDGAKAVKSAVKSSLVIPNLDSDDQ